MTVSELDPIEWKVEDKTPCLVGLPGGFSYLRFTLIQEQVPIYITPIISLSNVHLYA